MKKTKIVLVAAVAVALSVSVGALSGYVQRNSEKNEKNSEKVKSVAIEEETLVKKDKTVTHYRVEIESSEIVLTEIFDDETEKEIERVEINTVVLPENDVRVLSEGVAFSTKEEALILMENFIS